MNKFFRILTMVITMLGLNFFIEAHEGHEDKDVTITGEAMDLACYAGHPDSGQGLSHAKCARECMKKGLPVGILTPDGVLYVALGSEHKTANKILAPYAGRTVQATGHIKEVNHVKFFEIESLKEAKGAAPAAQ